MVRTNNGNVHKCILQTPATKLFVFVCMIVYLIVELLQRL